MTKYFNDINKILQDKGKKLSKDDVEFIRSRYSLFSIEEFESIGALEEVMYQIASNPSNDLSKSFSKLY
tara:strand:- start:51 stop:257 length:207 start_codon:yes stop_codon:yes gene_type:complete